MGRYLLKFEGGEGGGKGISNAQIYQNHFDTYSAQHDVTRYSAPADPSLRDLHTPISQRQRLQFLPFSERGFAYSRPFRSATAARRVCEKKKKGTNDGVPRTRCVVILNARWIDFSRGLHLHLASIIEIRKKETE